MEELSHQASLYKSSPCFEEKEDGAKAKAIKTAKAMKADQEPMEKSKNIRNSRSKRSKNSDVVGVKNESQRFTHRNSHRMTE